MTAAILTIALTTGAQAALRVTASDTIAGYSAALKTSIGSANTEVTFRIKKPSGAILELTETSDGRGIATLDLAGFHTKQAGKYELQAIASGNNDTPPATSFTVFADEPTEQRSRLTVIRDAAQADGEQQTEIKVARRDRHGNPVSDERVQLISSRDGDTITSGIDKQTDRHGEVYFYISSYDEGVAYLTALVPQRGLTLAQRGKVIFTERETRRTTESSWLYKASAIGGDEASLLDGNNDDEFSTIDHFRVEFEHEVVVEAATGNLKITALDAQDKIVSNYTGTILISTPDDPNATLPQAGQYTFTADDQGQRSFDLALIFATIGTQKIVVNDFTDGELSPQIGGEAIVEVKPDCVGSGCVVLFTGIKVTTPQPKAKLATGTVPIAGETDPNINVIAYLDEREVAEIEVGTDGKFTDQIKHVADGEHVLKLVEAQESNNKSEVIIFTVDTTPPTLDDIGIVPAGIVPAGEKYDITLLSEPQLKVVQVRIGTALIKLKEDPTQAGKYSGAENAPDSAGEFAIAVTLADTLGNETKIPNAAVLQVGAKTEPLDAPENVIITPGDGEVTVTWDAIASPRLDGYQILSGNNSLFLKQAEETDRKTLTATLTGLTNDRTINVAVVAVDTDGNRGQRSKVVTGEPTADNSNPALPAPTNLRGTAGNAQLTVQWDLLRDFDNVTGYQILSDRKSQFLSEEKRVSATTDTVTLRGLKNGAPLHIAIYAVGQDNLIGEQSDAIALTPVAPIVIPKPPKPKPPNLLNAVGSSNSALLTWSNPQDDQPALFDIRFGITPTDMYERFTVRGNARRTAVKDLINGTPYYFQVVPLDQYGLPTGEVYPLAKATPYLGAHPAASRPPIY